MAGIFGVVLLFVALATVASILATAGLGLIAFVPLAGFVVFPLTAAGWLLRGFVFQYLALTALGAYLTQYRHYLRGAAADRRRSRTAPGMIDYDAFLSRVGRGDAGVRDPQDGHAARPGPRHHLLRAGLSRRPTRSRGRSSRTSPASSCRGRDGAVLQYGPTRGYRPLLECIAAIMQQPRRARPAPNGCSSRPARSRDSTWSRASCSIRTTCMLVELPTYTGAITAFRNVQAPMVGVRQEADGIALDDLDADLAAAAPRGPPRPRASTSSRTSRTRPAC